MELLVLGGTVFVGRHIVLAAQAAGHRVTIFHRGTHGPCDIPGVTEIFGDRDGQLDRLPNRGWDAVWDTCGYVPRLVRASAQHLAGRVGVYGFISTVSVYRFDGAASLTESSPRQTLADPTTEAVTGETYGGLKVLCEEAVAETFSDSALILRPGIIAGPHDPTHRFTYWALRVAQGGPVLVPDRRSQPLQLVDVRDLADFAIRSLEDGTRGTFNIAGPHTAATFDDMLAACRVPGNPVEWVPASPDQLAEVGVEPWTELPLVLPSDGASDAMMRTEAQAAVAVGMRFRPWSETAAATRDWAHAFPPATPPRHGLDPAKELAAFAALRD